MGDAKPEIKPKADNALRDALADKRFVLGKTKISFRYLRKMNLIAGCLHLFQGIAMLGMAFAVENISNFNIPLISTYLTFDNNTRSLVQETKLLTEVNPGILVPFFLLLSAFFHFLVISPWAYNTYIVDINKGINKFRWYEYSISSSLMIWVIAMFFGVYDLSSLMLIAGVNASMNWFGFTMEVINQYTDKVQWESFVFGCIAGILPWIVIIIYFTGSPDGVEPPAFVYAIVFIYFFFFNTFPVNMVLQYAKVGRWADYRYGEMWYIILSLVSKTLLAWVVLGGTAQPNGDE